MDPLVSAPDSRRFLYFFLPALPFLNFYVQSFYPAWLQGGRLTSDHARLLYYIII